MSKLTGIEKMKEASDRGRITQKKRALEKYYASPPICKECGSVIPLNGQRPCVVKNKKFCNSSCSATFNNKKRNKKTKKCINCNNYYSGVSGSKFCSKACDLEFKDKQNYERFLRGECLTHRTIRNHLTRYRGEYKCCSCGNEGSWNGKPLVLEIEHLDGNPENNIPENLVWMCRNCHSQTDTYGAKNKGNGRHARRQRYAEGKSY